MKSLFSDHKIVWLIIFGFSIIRYLPKRKSSKVGVIEAMISSIKDNRRVRGERSTMRDRGDEFAYERSAPLEFRDSMTAEEHEEHQSKWRLRKRKSRIQLGIFFGVFVLFVSTFLIWLGI